MGIINLLYCCRDADLQTAIMSKDQLLSDYHCMDNGALGNHDAYKALNTAVQNPSFSMDWYTYSCCQKLIIKMTCVCAHQ